MPHGPVRPAAGAGGRVGACDDTLADADVPADLVALADSAVAGDDSDDATGADVEEPASGTDDPTLGELGGTKAVFLSECDEQLDATRAAAVTRVRIRSG